MRRIVMFNQVTPDGFFAAPDGGLDWVVNDEEVQRDGAAGMADTDTILFGRRTYEQFAGFWPHVLETAPNPQAGPHEARLRADANQREHPLHAMALWLDRTQKLVFSRTLERAGWNRSRVLRRIDPEEIEALKRGPGKDIILFGSGSVVSQLTEHGLIDEYVFVISPVLLGRGLPLFADVSRSRKLALVEAKPFPTGNVRLRYAPAA